MNRSSRPTVARNARGPGRPTVRRERLIITINEILEIPENIICKKIANVTAKKEIYILGASCKSICVNDKNLGLLVDGMMIFSKRASGL